MIEVKHLTKRYGEKLAVDDLSFSVKEGEILGFLGPNGAGKSTTMNILTGYLSATSGEVAIDGTDIAGDPEIAKRKIGYLPEIPPLYMDMTVEEYLRFMFRLKKIGKDADRERHISEICDRVRLRDVKKRLILHLSKGYRQRVGIAQALLGNPPILILDEPTVGLDPKQILEIRSLILSLREGHTILLSSHILQEIEAVCTRALILNEGKIAADDVKLSGERPAGYRLLVEGPGNEVQVRLRRLPGVRKVKHEGDEEPGVGVYTMETEPGCRIRRAVFDCVSENGWRLLGLERQEETLEQLFIRVTTGGAVRTGKETGR